MRFILFTSFFLLSTYICNAQNKHDFTISPKWSIGESKQIFEIYTKCNTIDGKDNIHKPDTTVIYIITILDKNNEGYIIEWRKLVNKDIINDLAFIEKFITEYKFVIKTDSLGSFVELLNVNSLIELNKKFKSQFIAEAKKHGLKKSEIKKELSKLDIPKKKSDLIEKCNNTINMFLGIYGLHLKLNDTVNKPTTITNQFIPEQIPVTLQTITTKIDEDRVSIRHSYIYDSLIMKALQKKYFPKQEYTEEKVTSYSEHIYNIKTGWHEIALFYFMSENKDYKIISILKQILQQ